jgi:hypothetical protein
MLLILTIILMNKVWIVLKKFCIIEWSRNYKQLFMLIILPGVSLMICSVYLVL